MNFKRITRFLCLLAVVYSIEDEDVDVYAMADKISPLRRRPTNMHRRLLALDDAFFFLTTNTEYPYSKIDL